MRILTVGHSTRTQEELLALLAAHGVETLVDVRRYPASRRHPHLGRAALEPALERAGVRYVWLGESLGGRRALPKDAAAHGGLRNASFRGYAFHMQSPLYEEGLRALLAEAARGTTAVMCAERHWSSCHRRMIADDLLGLRGHEVVHLVDAKRSEPHPLHPEARIEGGRVWYDRSRAGEAGQGGLFGV